jgi:hypothetical protein
MTTTVQVTPEVESSDPPSPVAGTLPLILLTAVLFAGAFAAYRIAPRLGPDNFPLWGLLLTLGFVAAIGSAVSWFFAVDEPAPVAPARVVVEVTPASTRTEARSELGRPAPEVVAARPVSPPSVGSGVGVAATLTPAEPWNEDALPPVSPRGPRPVLTTLDDPGDIGRALQEIADIQRELSTRRPTGDATAKTPARA